MNTKTGNTNVFYIIIVIVVVGVIGFFVLGDRESKGGLVSEMENGEKITEEKKENGNTGNEGGEMKEDKTLEDINLENSEPKVPGGTGEKEKTIFITYTNEGFAPNTIKVPLGGTVVWINDGDRSMWVASDIHPTHTIYPDSGIAKCGTEEAVNIFDACEERRNGESYSFAFEETGEWNYHNHLRPKDAGTIVVL